MYDMLSHFTVACAVKEHCNHLQILKLFWGRSSTNG